MPNKTRRRARRRNGASVKQLTQKLQQIAVQPRKKKATPFADAGAITGQRLGSMFNLPMLKGVGRWLGSGIGTIMGSGDYSLVGPQPNYNVLMNGNQIPKFSTTRQTNVVSHREYLGDITGTTAFTNTVYPLNPGLFTTFPWLSSAAQNYQQYKFHGIMFEFRSLITDFVTSGAPGVVVMSTNYNADVPAYNSKQEMENAEYAVATKPTCNLMHGIECASTQTVLSELYVRSGNVPIAQDLRLYDLGNFQLATQGNPNQLLGELWVTYTVEFFKPVMPETIGGDVQSYHIYRTGATGAAPLGTTPVLQSGSMNVVATSTKLTFNVNAGNNYYVTVSWVGTAVAVQGPTGPTTTNLSNFSIFQNDGASGSFSPTNGTTSTTLIYNVAYTALAPGLASLAFGTAGTLPGGASVDIVITVLDSSVTQ